MKKSLLLAIPALFTCGCSTSGAGGASGKIDCYYIGVNVGNTSVFSKTYSQSSVRVFEYKDTSGNKLYFNTRIQYEKTFWALIC